MMEIETTLQIPTADGRMQVVRCAIIRGSKWHTTYNNGMELRLPELRLIKLDAPLGADPVAIGYRLDALAEQLPDGVDWLEYLDTAAIPSLAWRVAEAFPPLFCGVEMRPREVAILPTIQRQATLSQGDSEDGLNMKAAYRLGTLAGRQKERNDLIEWLDDEITGQPNLTAASALQTLQMMGSEPRPDCSGDADVDG
jgi:hypothetical protein